MREARRAGRRPQAGARRATARRRCLGGAHDPAAVRESRVPPKSNRSTGRVTGHPARAIARAEAQSRVGPVCGQQCALRSVVQGAARRRLVRGPRKLQRLEMILFLILLIKHIYSGSTVAVASPDTRPAGARRRRRERTPRRTPDADGRTARTWSNMRGGLVGRRPSGPPEVVRAAPPIWLPPPQ